MKLTSPSDVRTLLNELDFQPSKALGQNFLIDRNILDILLNAADLSPKDHVIEVGPGLGVLTEELAERAGRVTAIEKDRRLAERLAGLFNDRETFRLIADDALDAAWPDDANKLVSNLPYASGTRILMECFTKDVRFDRIVVTVQEDVAERMIAEVSTKAYGLLSVWCRLDYTVRIVKIVRPTCFYPAPKVRSAIVALERLEEERTFDRARLHRLLKRAFEQRRKQMGTLFREAKDALEASGIDPKSRPENVSVEGWLALCERGI